MNIHPEVAEIAPLPRFTHWLIIPATDKHRSFAKAVVLLPDTCHRSIEAKGIEVRPYTDWHKTPYGLPTKPEYF